MSRIFAGLFWLAFLINGFYGSFLPYTLTGLVFRALVTLLLCAWIASGSLRLAALRSPVLLLFTVLTCYQGLSVFWADTPSLALDFLEGRFWILLLLWTAADFQAADVVAFRRAALRSFYFLALAGAAYGIYQVHVALPYLRTEMRGNLPAQGGAYLRALFATRLQSTEMFGTYLYPNLFGAFAALAVLALPVLPTRPRWVRWLHPVASALVLYALVASQSKGAWLSCVAGVAVTGATLLWRRRTRGGALLLLAALMAGAIGATVMFPMAVRPSLDVRFGYWQSALAMLHAHPWGVGADNFQEQYSMFMGPLATEVKKAHNDHLQAACEFGGPGLLLHLAFLLVLLREAGRALVAPSILPAPLLSPRPSLGGRGGKHEVARMPDVKDPHPGPLPGGEGVGELPRKLALPWPGLLAIAYLAWSCWLMGGGPMDLPSGAPLFLLLLVGFLFWSSRLEPGAGPWIAALPLAWVACFCAHSCLDFLFYDHSLVALFLILFVACVPVHAKPSTLPVALRLPAMLIFATGAVFFLSRFAALLPCAQVEFAAKLGQEDVAVLEQTAQEWPRELLPWQTLLLLERQPELRAPGGGEQLYRRALEESLRRRPHSSGLLLKAARNCTDARRAEGLYVLACSEYPRHPRYPYYLGLFLLRQGRDHEARSEFKRALALHAQAVAKTARLPDFHLLELAPDEQANAREALVGFGVGIAP